MYSLNQDQSSADGFFFFCGRGFAASPLPNCGSWIAASRFFGEGIGIAVSRFFGEGIGIAPSFCIPTQTGFVEPSLDQPSLSKSTIDIFLGSSSPAIPPVGPSPRPRFLLPPIVGTSIARDAAYEPIRLPIAFVSNSELFNIFFFMFSIAVSTASINSYVTLAVRTMPSSSTKLLTLW